MSPDRFIEFFEKYGGETHASRQLAYSRVRLHVEQLLEARGLSAGHPDYDSAMEAFAEAQRQYEARHGGMPTSPVADDALATVGSPALPAREPAPANDAPATQEPVDPVPAQVQGAQRNLWKPAALVLGAGLLLSMGLSALRTPSAPAVPPPAAPAAAAPQRSSVQIEADKRLAAAEVTFAQNLAAMDEISNALTAYRQREGRLPDTNGTFLLWPVVSARSELLLSTPKAPRSQRGTIIFRSDGKESYKLLFVQSGDCVVALLRRPELVDTIRSGSGLDCTYYGRWSADATSW